MPTINQRLEALQRRLGVDDDGLLGPVTMTRLEQVLDQALGPGSGTGGSLTVSLRGLDLMVAFEITSAAHYRRRLIHPTWPGAASGVTIGIGYDLGYNTALQVERDFRGLVPDRHLARLRQVCGLRGEAARQEVAALADIVVSLEAARHVFYTSTLPRYSGRTRRAYPGVDALPADAQAALLSLVFNRGGDMSGARRREMRAIKPLVLTRDLDGIAAQIRAMKRLWDRAKLPGLHHRRDREADLVANADRDYDPEELVVV